MPRSAASIQEGPDELLEQAVAASHGENSGPVAIACGTAVRRSPQAAPIALPTSSACYVPDPGLRRFWLWVALGAVLAALLTAALVGWLGGAAESEGGHDLASPWTYKVL